MKVGISTASFYPKVNIEDTLDIIKDLGFNVCEAFLGAESEASEDFAHKLAEKAKKLEIEVYSVHAFSHTFEPFLFDTYKRRRHDMEKKFEEVCKAGSILGARYYTFHGIKGIPSSITIDDVVKQLDYLCEIAESYGIGLSLENVSRCKGSSIDFINYIQANMKKNIYYTLDLKQARRINMDPFEYLKVYKNNIKNVHINDGSLDSVCLLPGQGNDDLNKIIKEISKINEEVPYIIEVYGDNYKDFSELEKARKYIESFEVFND